jgi:hypothetical protein
MLPGASLFAGFGATGAVVSLALGAGYGCGGGVGPRRRPLGGASGQQAGHRRLLCCRAPHAPYFRTDLPQVVIAMAVTRHGVPVRCWTFPGNENDQAIIRTVKDDLGSWNLRRLVWVADRGFAAAANRPT